MCMNSYEIKRSKKYRTIANKVIKERSDVAWIKQSAVKIAFVTSQQEKTKGNGKRLVCGECTKVSDTMQWICPYHFIITIYEQNCYGFTPEQYEILVWHELKHIGVNHDAVEESYYVVPHDYEDFREIIEAYGLDWNRVS